MNKDELIDKVLADFDSGDLSGEELIGMVENLIGFLNIDQVHEFADMYNYE